MVRRWDVVTIGNLSRNRYWGESDEKPLRPALCTSTLLTGEGFRLLVDPPLADAEAMAFELFRRTGLRPGAVTAVFVTHGHGDHFAGLGSFSGADWLAAPEVAAELNASGKAAKPVQGASGRLPGAIDVIPTPGHTANHHSLAFECDGRRVVVAGDAVMTRDFWDHRQGYFNSADFDQAAATIDRLAHVADIVVPGHDNYFLPRA